MFEVEVERTFRAVAVVEAEDAAHAEQVVKALIADGEIDEFIPEPEWLVDSVEIV